MHTYAYKYISIYVFTNTIKPTPEHRWTASWWSCPSSRTSRSTARWGRTMPSRPKYGLDCLTRGILTVLYVP